MSWMRVRVSVYRDVVVFNARATTTTTNAKGEPVSRRNRFTDVLVVCWVTFGSPHWMVESADLGKYPFPAVNARATLMSLRYSR